MAPLNRWFFCPSARLPDGWADHVLLEVDDLGTIVSILPSASPAMEADVRVLPGPTLPGMPNLHSHAFQRAIAGMTQRRGSGDDSFWTWREAMYGSLDAIGPDELEAIAAALYVELLEGGFTSIAEFHYVHHQPDGTPYADDAELSWRILAAAEQTGIGLTHLPVLYMTGGFDQRPLSRRQERFRWTPEGVLSLRERVDAHLSGQRNRRAGLALHSLRAVPPDALSHAVEGLRSTCPSSPIHIHIAEQTAEVEACRAHHGRRPVRWLCENWTVDARWCLVHATHIDADERQLLLEREAIAGLCPTTEADLGDGLFPAVEWARAQGRWGVGTDSHVGRSAADELRWLEYGQRLHHRGRNVLRFPSSVHTGAGAWLAAVEGGARALGLPVRGIAVGQQADLVSLYPHAPGLAGLAGDALVDAMVFGGAASPIHTVLVGGVPRVVDGRHVAREEVMPRFSRVLRHIRSVAV